MKRANLVAAIEADGGVETMLTFRQLPLSQRIDPDLSNDECSHHNEGDPPSFVRLNQKSDTSISNVQLGNGSLTQGIDGKTVARCGDDGQKRAINGTMNSMVVPR